LFRKEAQRILGEDFSGNGGARGRQPSAGRGAGASGPVRRDSRPSETTDLGIMKSLSSMGGAAKRNLSQLAERFSQSSRASNRTRNGETGTAREFKPLVDNAGDVSLVSYLS
jgi:hypothetical protein